MIRLLSALTLLRQIVAIGIVLLIVFGLVTADYNAVGSAMGEFIYNFQQGIQGKSDV